LSGARPILLSLTAQVLRGVLQTWECFSVPQVTDSCIKKIYRRSRPLSGLFLSLYTHGAFTACAKKQDEITVETLEPNTEDLHIFSSHLKVSSLLQKQGPQGKYSISLWSVLHL